MLLSYGYTNPHLKEFTNGELLVHRSPHPAFPCFLNYFYMKIIIPSENYCYIPFERHGCL